MLRCDGCAADIPAKVTYISTEAEYTPPVIYSNETRSKLVFMVEARPSADSRRPASRPTGRGKGALNGEFAIDVRDLNKHFGDKHVVKNVSLQVKPGEIFGFLGPNGSGKTTTIRMMCGLLTPDSGSGTCLGYDILRDSVADQAAAPAT